MFPAVVSAQNLITVKPWYNCGKDGAAFMMPGENVLAALDSGYTCNILDIDKTSSQGRACYLQWQFPDVSWAVFNPTIGIYDALDCSGFGPSSGSGSASGTAPGGGSGSGSGGAGSGGGSGSAGGTGFGSGGSSAVQTPTLAYGTWKWDASCPAGQYVGYLSFGDPGSGESFSGSFSSVGGGGIMSGGNIFGDQISFVREFDGRVQTWIGTIGPAGRTVVNGVVSESGFATCTFSAALR